ncbi:nuclear transport factor 2 family protein [Owenweeksia hongkongensis]|uniref:nuclear transport factor 2 family protein n=1 Tax=Owenweeksia hongkongensis TaxID=253245 RepID=UPI003A905E53
MKSRAEKNSMNNPKEEFVRKFNQAFLANDISFILESLTEDVYWEMVGERILDGKEKLKDFFDAMPEDSGLDSLEIHHIITHGKMASANGEMKMKDNSGKLKTYGFCDVYEFSGFKNPKIKKLVSYMVAKD